ncbi:hypothetical protein [Dokdonia pacifica]|uniref:Uncharacterized protein n=1 Tax=Dokdonia pacifica TaxID=1627892 RepID=A0A239DMA4_9FLAO|nr:hypothetical protein [Dokdonia pacifica]SNS33279.1 hypothetical protein SAMN06265376_11182 [Dokdonia pacifica]
MKNNRNPLKIVPFVLLAIYYFLIYQSNLNNTYKLSILIGIVVISVINYIFLIKKDIVTGGNAKYILLAFLVISMIIGAFFFK